MQFDPTENILFSDVDQNISQISLRHVESNKYILMYYYSGKRKLKDDIAASIEQDYANHDVARVDVETFGMLTFEVPLGEDKITEMNGSWYDLNGQMRALGLLLRERAKADATGNLRDYRAKLSSFVDGHSVSAKMGDVVFKRYE
jgi:hypothetical protein